tara:strand:+ start:110 stop:820 length:711 start_codon:yes stop_codon:yes gene_type:complete
MKKIIYLIFFFCLVSAQEGLKPLEKSTSNKEKFNMANNDLLIMLDEKNSVIEWTGGLKFVNNNHAGTLKIKSEKILLDKKKNISGKITVDMTTMTNTDMEPAKGGRLVGHLRGDDFFHVDRFPIATLDIRTSKIIGKTSSGLYKMKIEGDITIKGVKKYIAFDADIDLDSQIKKAMGVMTFNRADFGIQYRSEMHLENPDSFWNKIRSTKEATKDRVIRDEIEIKFKIYSKSIFGP